MYFAAKGAASKKTAKMIPHWILHFGVAGVFGAALFDASPVITPLPAVPDILIIILGANGESPWLLALCGVAGSLIGGYLTWAAGKKGGEAMFHHSMKKRQRWRDRITRWIHGHGMRTVMVAGLLPPPLPTLPILLAAGALGVTLRQFVVAFFASRAVRYGTEAALAAIYGRQILHLWNAYLSGVSMDVLYAFLGLLAISIVFGVWKFRQERRQHPNSRHQAGSRAA